MKFRTYSAPSAPSAPAVQSSDGYASSAVAAPDCLTPSAFVRICGILLLIAAIAAAMLYVGRGLVGGASGAGAGSLAASDVVPRTADLTRSILMQIEMMKERGMIAAIYDGSPTVVVVTDQYLESIAGIAEDLPLYDGHFVGFADDYTWQVNGHHNVILRHEDGTEIGRRTGAFSDAQVQQVYVQNRRRLESTSARVDYYAK